MYAEVPACRQTGLPLRRRGNPAKSLQGHSLGQSQDSPLALFRTGLRHCSPHNDTLFTILILLSITTSILFGITLIEPIMVYSQSKEKPVLSHEFRRDPFSLPSSVHLLSKSQTPSVTKGRFSTKEIKPVAPPLKINAILISNYIRLASIDRHIVTIGDMIQDEKILEIKEDRVILGKGDKERTLLLPQSPIQLTVEDR
jgi:hypothetical protein